MAVLLRSGCWRAYRLAPTVGAKPAGAVPPPSYMAACLEPACRGGARWEGLARDLRIASPGAGAWRRRMPDEVKTRRFSLWLEEGHQG